ncbi:MAG: carboxylate-amine ligase [Anaerolineaceae bacterium]|nr:MAG: carboxylate-amine ligase [Anaerolineaceae bacterium]
MAIPTPPLTMGIEEEYQIIDPETRDLYAYISKLLSLDKQRKTSLDLKPEFMQSQVEVGSQVCEDIKGIRAEVIRLRRAVCEMAEKNGVQIAAASSHPFARWQDQSITEGVRYKELLDDMQGVARRLLIFGMHVHVGFGSDEASKDLMIEIMNQARYFIPHLLALSTSSPFWHGRLTGLKSYRSVVFESMPRTGIPHTFESWDEYRSYENMLSRVGAFGKADKQAKIWWDIRPHPIFDTLEFRISDICTTVDEAVCIAALFQAICAKLIKLRRQNMSWRRYRYMHITENKWRAVRYGIDGELVDFGRETEVPFNVLMEELLDLLDDVVDDLGSRQEVEYVRTILEKGSSADRQIAVYQAHGGDENREEALQEVVDHLVRETQLGL